MARDPDAELRDSLIATRQALKGLRNHARAVMQLVTDVEERLALRDTDNPQPEEAQGNGQTPHRTDRRAVAV